MDNVNVSNANKHDIVWAVLKTLSPSLSDKVPTWAAYNSLLTSASVTTTVPVLPIVNGSPTLWENLYTAIKEAEKIIKHLPRWQKHHILRFTTLRRSHYASTET